MTIRATTFGASVVCFCLTSPAFSADNDAQVLLDGMVEALSSRNYEGIFDHIVGTDVESMKIVHRVQDGRVSERLTSLDGAGREIIRHGDEVKCILPDKQSVLVERSSDGRPLVGALPIFTEGLGAHYAFVTLGHDTIIGRPTRKIEITPTDEYRYGYRLWLDEKTHLPLKSQLRDHQGKVVEQIKFSRLELPETIADSEFEPDESTQSFNWYEQEPRTRALERSGTDDWRAGRVPAGFELSVSKTKMIASSDQPVEHLVYTDGLASVSVFIESSAGRVRIKAGHSRLGAANAYSTKIDDFHVTAVGEVPPITVETIAESVTQQTLDARR